MAVPRFNFTRLLIDLATAHNMPPPIFIPAVHPLPGHHAFVCSTPESTPLEVGQPRPPLITPLPDKCGSRWGI